MPATLTSPADRAALSYFAQPLTFTFVDPAVPADRAIVDEVFELATVPGFTSLLHTEPLPLAGGPTRTVALTSRRLPSGTYYWRVRTTFTDAPSAVSETRLFTMDEPTVALPVPDDSAANTYMGGANGVARRWPRSHAVAPISKSDTPVTQLEVQWSADATFQTLIEDRLVTAIDWSTTGAEFDLIPETLLPPSLTYWHRSRTVQPSRGNTSPWSVPWSATTPAASDQWMMWIRTCMGGFGLGGDVRYSGDTLEFRALEPRVSYDTNGRYAVTMVETGIDLGPDHLARAVNSPSFSWIPGALYGGGVSAGLPRSISATRDYVPLTWTRTAEGFGGFASAQSPLLSFWRDTPGDSQCHYATGQDFRWRLVAPGK